MTHPHSYHPDFKFTVGAEYIGTEPLVEGDLSTETHALIYSDGYVAVTLYEHCYAMWSVADGKLIGGNIWKQNEWRISRASLDLIRALP